MTFRVGEKDTLKNQNSILTHNLVEVHTTRTTLNRVEY